MKSIKFTSWQDMQSGMKVICTYNSSVVSECGLFGKLGMVKKEPNRSFGAYQIIWNDGSSEFSTWTDVNDFESLIEE